MSAIQITPYTRPVDIIDSAVMLCPSMLAEAMQSVSETHFNASLTMFDLDAKKTAQRLARACHDAVALIEADDSEGIMADFDCWSSVYLQACKLLLVPRTQMYEIVSRPEKEED